MMAEIGHFALILALALALVQSILPLVGAARRDAALMQSGTLCALGQFAFVALSYAALTYAYVVSDFSVINVAENSHTAKPMLYKITGVWGNHEGSLLLWILILSLCGGAVAVFGRHLPSGLKARVIGVQGMISLGFLLFILATSNPFLRLDPAPLDGRGLNPLLQDPGLAFHPPFLYLGYVGFSVAFSFAIAALIEGRVDPAWARWVRPWTLAAWCALTLGIALGSWWAYYELGWGGFWFWDPVENASFLPWLVGTALLHSAIVVERRDALKSWTILLAITTFILSLLGTFLVRSGVLTSVHAFAVDPDRGLFILALLGIAAIGGFGLYALRAPSLKAGGLFAPISREGGLVVNNLLLATAAATVLLGTLYPLILDALNAGTVSVGPPFFNMTFIPLMVPLVAVMAVGPLLPWKRGDLGGALTRLRLAGAATLAAVLATLILADGPAVAAVGIAMAAWLLGGVLTELAERLRLFRIPARQSWSRLKGLPRSAIGMSVAHAGMAITILGITASTAWQEENILIMRIGDTASVAGYELTLEEVAAVPGPNFTAERATLRVQRDGRDLGLMHPAKHHFTNPPMVTTQIAIRTNWLADLYVVLGDPGQPERGEAPGSWVMRLHHNPLVPWIWLGAVVMVLGGLVSLSDRRHRVGAPRVRDERASGRPPVGSAPSETAAASDLPPDDRKPGDRMPGHPAGA